MLHFKHIATLALFALAGCQSEMENPFFRVKESGLNWVEIRQYKVGKHTHRVRVRIDGNGIVTVREGTSPLVGNPYAHDVTNSQWGDIRETRVNISRDEANLLFQTLVDRGLFVKNLKTKEDKNEAGDSKDGEYLYVSANIQNKTASTKDPLGDPDIVEHLSNIVMMFYHPTPLRKP